MPFIIIASLSVIFILIGMFILLNSFKKKNRKEEIEEGYR